tara:strand:- start:1088 stop:3223 length:2136 start_codon:yes stop_codon:yes gene_type:complete
MKKYIYLFTILFLASLVQAQNVPFDKKLFKERKDEFKKAKQNLDMGDDIFNLYPPNFMEINEPDFINRKISYREALPLLFKANKFNPNNAELNYKIGRCYLMNIVYKDESIKHLLQAQKLNPGVAHDIQYHLGIGYHIAMKFDKAIAAFKIYKQSLVSKNPIEHDDIDKRIRECETAKSLVANPERVFIDNFGRPVNGKYPEYGAIISADESVMMFTSRRNTSTGAERQDPGMNDYYEDIYITTKEKGNWTPPKNMGSQINTEMHDATTAISPDGQRMIIYRDTKGDGNLYECVLTGSTWSKPVKMNKNINTKHHESSASYSSDGSVLYFVSNKPDGYGAHDIYVTHWDEENSEWGESQNVGPTLNTEHDEEAVFFHPDGKTLYFSSRGHKTMGNYDVFKSTLKEDDTWGIPENMGYPINTVDDDVFFVINGSGRRGYYSSFRDDGQGEKDIYQITFLGPEKPFQLSSEDNLLASVTQPLKDKVVEKKINTSSKRITILKGIITDCKTSEPVHASLELIDIDDNKTLATFESNATTGKYLVSLPSGKNYALIVRKESYLFHSENFNISDSAAYEEVEKDICLKKIEVGSVIVLKNIFYDYNKASLRDASKNELDRLIKLLNENPTIKIELSAHTDSRGSNSYNQKLSQRRAQSCVDYLIVGGIATGRLVTKGYGETQLIRTDAEIAKLTFQEEKEDAHQENRRTEFKIIEK